MVIMHPLHADLIKVAQEPSVHVDERVGLVHVKMFVINL